jgi:hypothetical protein
MLTGYGTNTASNAQAPGFQRIQSYFDRCFWQIQMEPLVGKRYLLKQINIIFPAGHNQLLALGAYHLAGLGIG